MSGRLLVAIDAGGTMTDCLVVADKKFVVGKALTNREDEASSYLESVADAGGFLGLDSNAVHGQTQAVLYTGTAILNTILTGTGSRVGMIVTRGFEHITVMEGALTWLGEPQEHLLHYQLRRHTQPLVDPENVIGVSERISGDSMFPGAGVKAGEILIPLRAEEVELAANRLLDRAVDVIGILFLHSHVNPAHELAAKAIVEETIRRRRPGVRVIASHEVAPVIKENNRSKSLLFQAYAAEKTYTQLAGVEKCARQQGYQGRLLTLLSYGGAVNIEYPRLYETVISGPIGGLIGAQAVARVMKLNNLVTADLGGTSFDVGLLVQGTIQVRRAADYARHRLATPMVAIDSVGSGAGSVVRVDQFRRVRVGPESAGARVGVCYNYPDLTITDINVALGYVDPNYFLGGKVKLDRDRALAELEKRVAQPLGMNVYAAGSGILEILHSQTRHLLQTMLVAKGHDPSEFAALCFGGAGPLHMWGFTEDVGLAQVLTVPWAAGFSAWGAACAEYEHRYERSLSVNLRPNADSDAKLAAGREIDACWRILEGKAVEELAAEGMRDSQVIVHYGVSARYLGQLESFDVPLGFGHIKVSQDVDTIIAAFETTYGKIYPEGARFPEAGYVITEAYIRATVPKPTPSLVKYPLAGRTPLDSAFVESRKVFHKGRWQQFRTWEMGELKSGNVVHGPAIIRDPMTTLVIPPNHEAALDAFKVIHYRKESA
jgi:acetone carboxylase, beta subunit